MCNGNSWYRVGVIRLTMIVVYRFLFVIKIRAKITSAGCPVVGHVTLYLLNEWMMIDYNL